MQQYRIGPVIIKLNSDLRLTSFFWRSDKGGTALDFLQFPIYVPGIDGQRLAKTFICFYISRLAFPKPFFLYESAFTAAVTLKSPLRRE